MSVTLYPQQRYTNGYLIRMASPLILSFLLEQLIGMMDVAFLGRVGEVELGAAAPAGVAFLTLLMFGVGYTMAVQSYMSRRNGEKAYEMIGASFRTGSLFLLGIAALLIGLTIWLSPVFFSSVCDSPNVAEKADQYMFWRVMGLPCAYLCCMYRAFFVATLKPNILSTSSLVMVVTNGVLNYMLIFGCGPIPAMGIAGAAIASTLAEAVCLLFFTFYARQKTDHRRYTLFSGQGVTRELNASLFRLGRWLMIQEAFAFAAWLIFFIAVEHLGELSLAISNIVRQVASTLFLVIHGFGSACGAVAANLLGENRADEVPDICRRGLLLCLVFMTPLIGLAGLFPEHVLMIFTEIEDVLGAANPTFYVMLGSYIVAIPSMFFLYVMGGMGMTKETSYASLTAVFGYLAYIWLIMGMSRNVAAVWTADYVYYALFGIVAGYYYLKGEWKTRKI